MSGLIASIASLLGGGISGIIGAGINKYFEHQTKKLEFDHAIALRSVDLEAMDKEWAGRAAVAEVEASTKAQEISADLLQFSVSSDIAKYSEAKTSGWMIAVDFVRGMIRPVITIYFAILASYLGYKLWNYLGGIQGTLTTDQMYEMIFYSILWVDYTAGMCIGWWFGARPSAAPNLPKLR